MADLVYPDYKVRSTGAEVVFTGTWTQNQADNSGHNTSDKFATSSTTGDYVTITPDQEFTDAFLFCNVGKTFGIAKVEVDGKLIGNFDHFVWLDGSNVMRNACSVRISGLSRGKHVIKMTVTGDKNADSTGSMIGFSHAYIMDPAYPVGTPLGNVMLVCGDSITDSQSSYGDKWIKSLVNNYKPSNKIRWEYATRPGVTSDYLNKFFENEVLAKRVSYASVLIGTNDLPQPKVDTKTTLLNMINVCKTRKVPIIIGTIPPRQGLDKALWDKTNNQIREICMANDILVMDFNKIVFNNTATTSSPINSDGIHPDQIGHSLMAKVMFDTMLDSKSLHRNLIH